MSLLERTTVQAEAFSMEGFEPLYARIGLGPSKASDYAIPQRSSCVVRRLLTNSYLLNRFEPAAVGQPLKWPVRAPQHIVIVELRDEHLCFRMRNLAFFEKRLRLSTILNAQIPWLAFESPLITRLSGTGRVGIRIDGQPDCLASGPAESPPQVKPQVNMLRLAAWSGDTRLGVDVEPGYSNTVLVAPATAVVHSSALVIASRDDGEGGAAGLLQRIGRLIVP